MTRDEFLSELENALNGSVKPALVNENLRYYEEYIETEKRKGNSEAAVLEELGDPRLIARTIIDTADTRDKRGMDAVYDYGETVEDGDTEDRPEEGNIKITKVSGARVMLVIAAVLIIFFLIFTAALFLVGSFIVAFWPAIIVAAVIWAILRSR